MKQLQFAQQQGDTREVWQINRILPETPLGPKKRFYGRLSPIVPTTPQWTSYLGQAGPRGGCRAFLVAESPVTSAEIPLQNTLEQLQRDDTSQALADKYGGGTGFFTSASSSVPWQICEKKELSMTN